MQRQNRACSALSPPNGAANRRPAFTRIPHHIVPHPRCHHVDASYHNARTCCTHTIAVRTLTHRKHATPKTGVNEELASSNRYTRFSPSVQQQTAALPAFHIPTYTYYQTVSSQSHNTNTRRRCSPPKPFRARILGSSLPRTQDPLIVTQKPLQRRARVLHRIPRF